MIIKYVTIKLSVSRESPNSFVFINVCLYHKSFKTPWCQKVSSAFFAYTYKLKSISLLWTISKSLLVFRPSFRRGILLLLLTRGNLRSRLQSRLLLRLHMCLHLIERITLSLSDTVHGKQMNL